MAEIRAGVSATAATTGNFSGFGAPTPCSPLVYDPSNGDLYVILPGDVVTKIGFSVASADLNIAVQAIGKHIVPAPVNQQDASEHLSNRIFDRPVLEAPELRKDIDPLAVKVFARQTLPVVPPTEDANAHLASRAFDRAVPAAPDLRQTVDVLAARVFDRQFSPPASTDDASTHLSQRAFDRAIPGAPELRQLIDVLAARAFTREVLPSQAVLGDASDIIASRAFGPKQLPPAMWS